MYQRSKVLTNILWIIAYTSKITSKHSRTGWKLICFSFVTGLVDHDLLTFIRKTKRRRRGRCRRGKSRGKQDEENRKRKGQKEKEEERKSRGQEEEERTGGE